MGADSDSGGEAIVICIDDTTSPDYFNFQVEAVKAYAKYKIKSHPRTVVGVITMTPAPFHLRFVLRPTRDLDHLFWRCKCIPIGGGFSLDVPGAITNSLFMLNYSFEIPKGVQKRIVMFAGRCMNMDVIEYPKIFIKKGVAIDVVNFASGDMRNFRKKNLEAFVDAVNIQGNGNSRIIHVEEGYSVSDLLSSFMAGDEHNKANKKKNKRKANRMMNKHKAKKMKNKDHQPSLNRVLHSCTA